MPRRARSRVDRRATRHEQTVPPVKRQAAGRMEQSNAMKTYKIAAIPADGIGPEVIAAGLQALEALQRRIGGFTLEVTHFD